MLTKVKRHWVFEVDPSAAFCRSLRPCDEECCFAVPVARAFVSEVGDDYDSNVNGWILR